MDQTEPTQKTDSYLATLDVATRQYRLRDRTLSNEGVATTLGLEHYFGDFRGKPNCCFFMDGEIVAIRTKPEEIAIFHVWQSFQQKMGAIGDRIPYP